MEQFLHVTFPVELEIGRLRMSLAKALNLAEGDVLRTEQTAGTGLSVYVADVLLATADPVMINGKLGVRIQSVMGPNGSR
jgi:flagellar motor switch/type III secretory pathway protein FliN